MARLLFCFLLVLGIPAYAREGSGSKTIDLPPDNPMAELKPGPGVEVVRANCAICHSTDYVVRQPRGDQQKWQGEVKKMIDVFGAPISAPDAEVIVRYLASAYGPQSIQPQTEPAKSPVPQKGPEKPR